MKYLARINLLAFIGLTLIAFPTSTAFAQKRGSETNRVSLGIPPDSNSPGLYIKTLGLKCDNKNAYRKWTAKAKRFTAKNRKYAGKTLAPDLLDELKAENTKLNVEFESLISIYKEKLSSFLKLKQMEAIAK